MKNYLKWVILFLFTLDAFVIHLEAQSKSILTGFSMNKYFYNRHQFKKNDTVSNNGTGYTIGFYFEKPIWKKTSVLIGFGFLQRNEETKYISWPNSNRSNYATFPVSINYYIFNHLALQTGIQFDHLIFKQKFVYYSDSIGLHSGYTKYDIGILSGIRFQFYNFELNGSFTLGLKKI
ncbi:MAG: outer membrane beta-barrel protein, partial [Saprospiraceae bacterium]